MVFFCVKRFWPITRVENNSQEKSTILHVPHIGFLCYSNWDQILLYGRWLKVRMNICTALWSFVNFCCLSQSEVSTDNRKVSTFLAFQHVRCHALLLSFLSGLLLKVAEHSFGSLWEYVICQIMAREGLQPTSWNLAVEKYTDERFWLTGKIWHFRSFHGNMNDWIQP